MLVLPNGNNNRIECDVDKAYIDAELKKKVDKVGGKGLSTNDFTNDHKEKLEQLNVIWETMEG